MSGPNPKQLQRHKDSVRDTLQGLLDTAAQIPGLIHEQSSKELSAVTTATALREGAYQHTQQALDDLPAELSAFDQVLDEVLASAHGITTGLSTLRGFNTRSPIRPQARVPPQQTPQQQGQGQERAQQPEQEREQQQQRGEAELEP